MTWAPERKLLADNNLDASINLLQEIIDVLNDIKGNKMSFASSCKKHKLNERKVRQYLISLPKCQLTNIVSLESLVEDELDYYEFFYSEVFGADIVEVRAMLPYDYKESVEYVLNNTELSEREVFILRNRFGLTESEERLTFEELGKRLNVCRNRAQELEHKAMRRIRNPGRTKILVKGLSAYTSEKEQKKQFHENEIARRSKIFQEQLSQRMQEQFSLPIDSFLKEIDINDLNLSTRSYNCLIRNGCKYIFDILNTPTEKLMRFRNLGHNSLCEIFDKLNEFLIDNFKTTLKEYHSTYHYGEEELYSNYK